MLYDIDKVWMGNLGREKMQDKNNKVQAVVLAAGQGKRMKSDLPKMLHEVLGRSIISRVLDCLSALPIEKIHIVLGHGEKQIRQFLDANLPDVEVVYYRQEPQLGTGHALMQVVPGLSQFDGTLLLTYGDTPLLTSNTLAELLQEHQNAGATLSLLTAKLDDAKNYGRIVRNDKGQLLQIVEDKDATPEQKAIKEINSGIYCFQWPQISNGLAALKNDNQQKEYYLTDLVAWAVKEKHTVASKVAQDVSEVSGINSRAELAEASRLLNERALRKLALDSGVTIVDWQSTWIAPEVEIGKDSTVLPGCYLTGKIEIGASCVIGPQTVMKGPVRIGDRSTVLLSYLTNSQVGADCRVGPFAHLRDNAQAADNVRIGNYVEIKNSQIGSHTNVSHLSYVGDASLGSQVNIGAGTITANYDHVSKLKSRTTMKDGASTGCNAVLVAPVVVGKESVVAAGTVVTKDVPDGALAVGRARQEVKAGWTESKKRKLDGQAATKTGKS